MSELFLGLIIEKDHDPFSAILQMLTSVLHGRSFGKDNPRIYRSKMFENAMLFEIQRRQVTLAMSLAGASKFHRARPQIGRH